MIDELRWPSLQERRQTARLAMLYKIRNGLACVDSIGQKLELAIDRIRRGHNQQYSKQNYRIQYQQHSFLPKTVCDWNQLPQSGMELEATTINTFVSRASKILN